MGVSEYEGILYAVAALITAIAGLAVFQGRKEHKRKDPQSDTMKTIQALVSKSSCAAPALSSDLGAIKNGLSQLSRDQDAMRRDVDQIRDVVTRIEDRTKRGG